MLLTLKEASMAAGSPSMAVAWWSLLIGSVVGVPSAEATDHPAAGLPPHARAAVRAYEANSGIPAFARKYGMKCSACHLAVPLLTPFGQAFRDNGYRMKNGNDDLRANEPGYWPLFAWLWKDYQVDVDRVAGQTVQRQGGFANGAFVFGGMGSISDKVSFRMFPVIYEDGLTFAGHGWIRYNQAFGTDWVNIKVGQSELDVPINPGREYNMGNARFAVLYAYTVPGSVSRFNVLFPQPGVEIMGHDRGSRNRYMVNVFDADGAPRAHCTFCAPGVFGRVTHRHDLASGFLRRVQVGAFGAYSTWPVGPDTSDLKGQRRFGGDVELWLGSDVLPFRVTVMGLTGRDDRALVPTATQDPKYNAGMLQLEYVPKLPLVFYSRLQIIRNQRQAVAGRPDDYGDQDFQLVGVRHALELTSRFAWLLELTYWRQTIKQVAPGTNATHQQLWIGSHLLF
jgi:cytochrome c5